MSKDKEGVVLVTGATGFVALHVVRLLQLEGYRVRGTVRSLKNEAKLKPLKELCPEARHAVELVEADLTRDEGWDDALGGCKYCIHVASPFPDVLPRREADLIVPALEGTNRVLRACAYSGTVKRIVLTSSIASVHGEFEHEVDRVYTEEDWTDLSRNVEPYARSKTLAERAAWDFLKALRPERNIELVTLNPGIIFGPSISGISCTSITMIKRLMDLTIPLVPKMYIAFCDVRDVALAHLRAMTVPEAANNRHLIISDHMWYRDVAQVLKDEFGQYGYWIPTWQTPNMFVYIGGFIDRQSNLIYPRLGINYKFSNRRMKEVLKVEPRNVKDTIIDTAYSLIESGVLSKSKNYKPKKVTF